jgi:hypothetical protein
MRFRIFIFLFLCVFRRGEERKKNKIGLGVGTRWLFMQM